MLTTIGELRRRIQTGMPRLIAELQESTGRFGSEEREAWSESLPKMSRMFQADAFQPLHLYFGTRGNVALEYQLPAASSWCDVVLLGAHEGRPSAVIMELKHWMTRSDRPGRYEGLIERQGRQVLHPSDQVRGYTEYCRRFHSAVAEHDATVHGCVLITGDGWARSYSQPPNDRLAIAFPLFADTRVDKEQRFPDYFSSRLTAPDEKFATAFSEGEYRQDRGFIAQIGRQILDPSSSAFELLDGQRVAFALCRSIVADAFHSDQVEPPKKVIIIEGPPGSGKSAIAARLWASLVTDEKLPEGDVVFTTTSMSQNTNWDHLFQGVGNDHAAGGVIRKATTYLPITTQRVGALRQRHGPHFLENAEKWRENLRALAILGEEYRDGARDSQNLVSIVDEAHALINPEHKSGRGQFGFAPTLGPQAYHIIRSSMLSVFLLDSKQGFRERENTTVEDIQKWSRDLGAGEPELISLEGAQFRCAGSAEYVEWVESLLSDATSDRNVVLAKKWTKRVNEQGMDVRVFDDPEPWEEALRDRETEGRSVRLVSSYSRKWVTSDVANPHLLDAEFQDFRVNYRSGGIERTWNRVWNHLPGGNNYTWFVAGVPGSYIADDSLCEVGCPYVVRGFDFDYVGVVWLNDLEWRDERWRVDPLAVEESGVRELTMAARQEASNGLRGPANHALVQRVEQAYRILLTRALKGVYMWIPDAGTRDHIISSFRRPLDQPK